MRATDDADDLKAIRETISGRTEAFRRLVDRYTDVVHRLAHRLLRDETEAEDATQEIFLKAFDALDRFQAGRRFYPWLYTIAFNHLRTMTARRDHRERAARLPYEDRVAASDAGRAIGEPEHELLRREGERELRGAIDRLPPHYREVVILRQFEELSVAEVAAIMEIPEGTVKTYLHRAKQALAKDLAHFRSETSGFESSREDDDGM